MGCLWSCCQITENQSEDSEVYGVMPRPGTMQNYLSSSIDSMALLPPLQRPDLRGIAKPRQPSGNSSPSGTRSLVRPRTSAPVAAARVTAAASTLRHDSHPQP
ncbi:hypothetical protein MTO96_003762 [Rhipicephalus appendiculatus]